MKVSCFQCGDKGHFTRRCPKEQCPNCKEYGHPFKDCYVLSPLNPPLFCNFYARNVDCRLCLNVVVVEKVDTRSVIVLKGVVKPVENQLIDDMNVVQEYKFPSSPSFLFPHFVPAVSFLGGKFVLMGYSILWNR